MENVSPVLSLTPVPEQSQDHMESCSQGVGEGDSQQKEQFQTEIANVAEETVEESDKSSKGNSPIKKTWGFRQSTVAKREMPVEAATSSSENCCPVRRSRRQAKRTDKLEEFLLTAKRGTRKSAPPSLESGDPPSQTPTDAETASEASFDGNADTKAAESPERRTRSSTRKQTLHKTRSGRQTRSSGGAAASDQGSSENEESRDPAKNDQLQNDEMKEETNDSSPKDVDGTKKAESPPEIDSDKKEVIEEKDQHGKEQDKAEIEKDTDEESEDNPSALVVKRGPLRTYVNKKKAANKTTAANKVITPVKRETKPKATPAAGKTRMTHNNDENDSSTSSSSSSSSPESDGGYDPNALYCICRQRHNKRFMICCDRCEEWFHGDCVGITEARGRLMERNGEDYVCPNCTAKKNQVVRPATSLLSTNIEGMKSKADVAPLTSAENSTAEKTNTSMGLSAVTVATPPSSISTGTEEKGSEDIGIKGRIEKATNPTGKKKIKIFQPQVMQQTAEPKAAQKALVEKKAVPTADQKALPDTEQKVASNVEVKTSPVGEEQRQKVGEESSLPKCIGPGCESNAQPDSVYCGNDCILRHAAVTMKSITDVKEPTQKEEAQKSTQKKSPAGRKKTRKTTDEDLDSDEDYSPDLDEDDEDEHAEEYPPSPTTASWSSDHNYIAVAPEKTTTISPTVLNKKSPPKEEKRSEKEQKEKESAVTPEKPSPAPAAPVTRNQKSTATKKSPTTKAAKVSLKSKKRTVRTSSSKTSKKPEPAPSKTAAKGKKAAPSASRTPSPFPPGPIHVTGALRVVKSNFTIPKKQPQQKDSHSHSSSSLSRVPSSPVSSSPSAHSSSSSSSRPSHPAASPMPPPPNNQMRQNIRRSLTDILYKRVSDSDDLKMTESEVGRLAVGIEKEMFNLCLSTDSKYKNKYRSLMFNLKDPKNKGLFYRVISGEVSPFRLVRLSAEELLSKEISEWRKPDAPEAQSHSTRHHSGQSKLSSRHDSSSHSIDSEDAPPTSDADDQDESGCSPSASAQASAVDGANNMPDIFSNMLKDTTSEHRAHLFDLNCKICTGQRTEDEPAAKKAKLTKKSETRPSTQDSSRPDNASPAVQPQDSTAYHHQDPLAYPHSLPSSYQSNLDIPEVQQQQPHQDDLNMLIPLMQAPVPLVPTVSSVSITRRDPRMARHSSSVTVTYTAPEKPTNTVAEGLHAPVTASVEIVPKAPLPMPPASPSSAAILKSSKTSTSEPPPEGETAIFLHGQERIWKGFINMHSVAKFVTKAYLVSGSFEHLKEDLPDTILIEGRISPNTVWDYVGKLKTSLSKELCLIRFHPATEEEEVAYVSLFSYFSSRKRFGVVAKNNRRIKDLYLIPLGSKDPLPSKLLPFDGPGLEPARPNLLLGLLICQKDRKRTGASLETEEKRFKAQTKEVEDTGLPKPPLSVRAERNTRLSMEIPFSTTPPGSPPSTSVEASSGIVTPSSGMSLLSAVKASPNSSTIGRDSPTSSSSISSSAPVANPLQTILNTLFRKKTPNSDASNSPSDQGGGLSIPPATMLDPIVKQYAQTSKGKPEEEDEDDRPYDPEEEYDPSRGYSVPKKSVELVSKVDVLKQPEIAASEADDVAYDPEDDSIFDEVKPLVSSQAKTSSECNPEPQKILESLKQIGDQTHQSQGDQQMLSTETSGASQTLVDTLIPPSTKSLLANSQLLQLGKQVEALVKSSTVAPLINQRRDPRQSRDLHQTSTGFKSADESEEKEETPAPLKDSAPPSKPQLPDVPDLPDSSQAGETIQPKEEVKCDSLPFMELDKSEVSIPLLGEEMGPDMEFNYMDEKEEKSEEAELSVESEKEVDKYSVWPNAASILKATDDSDHDENSRDTSVTSFFKETEITNTITSAIPVLTKTTIAESQPHHISHRISAPGFDSEYRPLADISPQSTFPTPHPMQGQNLIMRPPPMTIPPPTEGLSPMSGPPLMQGPLPPIHVPPSVRAPPPMQGDSSQQYGPPLTSFPPYQNQWRGIQPLPQQPPPGPAPQNILPPRGPPLPPFPPVAQRGPPHMFDASIAPQHIGKQGPPPGLPPPPTFDRQSTLPPPRFTGPPPPFNFPASRGPPHPPFTVPPPGHFDNRLPPPSHFHAPRGAPPSQYSDFKTQPPLVDQHRGPAEQYNKDSPNSFKLNMDQNPNSHHIFKDNQALPPGPAYRGPPSSQYEDRRGPPPSGEVSGQHFNQHNQYGSSRQHSSPPHRGSFDDHRVPLPQENRPHSSQPFGGSEHYRFDRHSDEPRPVRHSGPLLPTPPDISLGPPSRIGAHSPDLHRDDNWRLLSPEMRRRSSLTQEDLETRSGDHISRFDGGHREPAMGPSQPSNERQREVSEDRRGLRGEREVPHVGRPSWDRGQGKRWSREREWDRGKERDRDHERSRERDRSRGKEGDRHRDMEGERHRDQESDKRRDRERERPRARESDRRDYNRERVKNRDRERDHDRERDRDRDRERDRERERERERDRDRERERDHDRDRDRDRRDRERDRKRDRSRSRERSRDRDRDHGKDRGRDRDRDRDRERDRDRDKDRDRRERSRSREKREDRKDSKRETAKESDKTDDKNVS